MGRFVSIYVPADSSERSKFIRRLRSQKILRRGDIIQGDINCVPDVTLDVLRPDGKNTKYPNLGGAAFESLMASLGLADIYRSFHGRAGRQYTRQKSQIHTRLDRFYSQSSQNDIVWYEVSLLASFCRSTNWSSDHYAITALIGPLGEDKKESLHEGIDRKLLTNEEISNELKAIFNESIAAFPPNEYTHEPAWARFKELA